MSILFLCFLALSGEPACVYTGIVQKTEACDFSAFLIARTDPRILSSWCEHIEGSL